MLFKLLFILIVSISCNENFSGGNRVKEPPQEEEQIAPAPEDFMTRLNSTLLIKGIICQGTETTEAGGHGSNCLARQYLIFIDDVNTCNSDGQCTNFEVIPIVGDLQNIDARTSGVSIFSIIPIGPASNTQEDILNSVNVSSDLNGNGTVFLND